MAAKRQAKAVDVSDERPMSARDERELAAAQDRLGAGAKGYMQRRRAKQEKEEQGRAATKMQANFRGRKGRGEGSEVSIRRERHKNDPQVAAGEYIKKHKLIELFELLGQSLVAEQPADVRSFLIGRLKELQKVPEPTSALNFFNADDVDVLFSMFDASQRGLTAAQCRQALDSLGLEKVPVPKEPARFDIVAFRALVLG